MVKKIGTKAAKPPNKAATNDAKVVINTNPGAGKSFVLGELLRAARAPFSLVEASERLGVSKNTLLDYEQSKRLPGLEFLRDFAQQFDVNAADLAGELLKLMFPGASHLRLQGQRLEDEARVPVYDVNFSAGNGGWNTEEALVDHIPVPTKLLRSWGIPTDQAAFVKNAGDSMVPTLGDGDMVLLDRSVDSVVLTDMIYAFRLNDELRIKRIRKLPGGGVELKSDNPAYAPEKLPGPNLFDFKVLGRVRTVWRNLP